MATRDDAELAEIFKDMSTVDLSFFSNSTTVQVMAYFFPPRSTRFGLSGALLVQQLHST